MLGLLSHKDFLIDLLQFGYEMFFIAHALKVWSPSNIPRGV